MSQLVLVANAGDGTISSLRLHTDEAQARLEPLATSRVGDGCGTFAVDVERGLVFAADKGEPAGIVTLALDAQSGELSELSRRDVDASLTYLALGAGGRLLLGASYGGGFGAVWPVDEQGGVADPVSRIEFANLHCVVPVDSYAYFVSLHDDLVAQYSLDVDGTLTPLDPPTVAAPKGSGPRHLIVDGSNGYLMTEFSGEVIHFEVAADGTLTRAEAQSAVDPEAGLAHNWFGADPRAEHLIWGADLHFAGTDAQWLLASERMASTIATLPLKAGRLGPATAFTASEEQTRGFDVCPDGRYVVAVGERSTDAALSSVDADGTLTLVQRVPVGSGANWVRILTV